MTIYQPERVPVTWSDPILRNPVAHAKYTACDRKRRYRDMETAIALSLPGQVPYICPFGKHWHSTTDKAD